MDCDFSAGGMAVDARARCGVGLVDDTMTHEPECILLATCHQCGLERPVCICKWLRAAYQRGRRDAAKDVEWYGLTHRLPVDLRFDLPRVARGDAQ